MIFRDPRDFRADFEMVEWMILSDFKNVAVFQNYQFQHLRSILLKNFFKSPESSLDQIVNQFRDVFPPSRGSFNITCRNMWHAKTSYFTLESSCVTVHRRGQLQRSKYSSVTELSELKFIANNGPSKPTNSEKFHNL